MVLFCGRQKHSFFFFLMIFAFISLCVSCTDFFSNSWATWAARDPDRLIPTVTASNVDELIALAENNPDLSLAILKKIQKAVNSASGADLIKLQNAALQVGVNAAGLGQAVLNAAGELTNVKTDADARDMVVNALGGMKNLNASCAALPLILPDPSDTEAFNAFTDSASVDDLALAAALLIAGEANKYDQPDDYIENTFNSNRPIGQNEELAVALIDSVRLRQEELSESLEDILYGLNLL